MKNDLTRFGWILLVLLTASMAGCMGGLPMVDEQPWYLQGSGMYDTPDGKRFYGVGRAEGIRSTTLLKATAANMARKEMGRVLRKYVAELSAEAASLMPNNSLSADGWVQVRGLVVRNAVQRAVISDHYAPGPNRLLSLCELDMGMFKGILADDRLPEARARQAMHRAADKVHARLSRPFQSN